MPRQKLVQLVIAASQGFGLDNDRLTRGEPEFTGPSGPAAPPLYLPWARSPREWKVAMAQRIDFNGLVICAVDRVRDQLAHGVRLQFELGRGPLRVRARLEPLEHAVLALLLNARDAMPEGGRLRVRTCRHGPWVRLVVHDTGTPASHRPRPTRWPHPVHLRDAADTMHAFGGWVRTTSSPARGLVTGTRIEAFLPLS